MLRIFIVHICVKALFLELLCVFYILISNVTDVGCALICYVPILQRAFVLGIPAERVVQRERSSANKGASARKRWLAAALSEVCSSRWGIPPPQTPPSNCDCSRSEHRSSVWVGVSKALDRFVASLMVDLSSLMSSGDVKAQIRFKSLQNLIWSSCHRHLESRDPRERGGCLCACFLTCYSRLVQTWMLILACVCNFVS